ncbi:hypothetical protein WJX73_000007 [Symbiochloris irregularis]|uniref:Mitochondrial-processing peptidase subunit alpha n=1 Tax=Symbiochloris irregularis TaxID=706552 RepID=A0AAW1P4U4_9CHLO
MACSPAQRMPAPQMKTTELSNGVKVASEASYGPTATLGLYVDAGSVYESAQQTGTSHLLEYMAFKSTQNRTFFRLTREVEAIGGNVMASASREQMVYTVDVLKTNVAEALEVLADAVLNPKFHPWEVDEQKAKLEGDLKAMKNNPQTVLLEGLHETAWNGGLGRPLVCPEGAVGALSAEGLQHFHSQLYKAPHLVLAGAGVEHTELLGLSKPLLESLPKQGKVSQPASKYLGGDFRQFQVGGLTHLMLAFEFPGGWRDVKGSVAVTVLQFLLGGGGSFSTGGPGKGMHSRLYRNVLNQYGWMHNCTAFNSLYNDTGVVGVFATCEASKAEDATDVITKELQALAKDVPEQDLERAKRATASSVLMNLENRNVVAEDIGRQILTYGHRKQVSEFLDTIKSIKPSDISALATKLMKTPLSMASLGDINLVPRYSNVEKRFG